MQLDATVQSKQNKSKTEQYKRNDIGIDNNWKYRNTEKYMKKEKEEETEKIAFYVPIEYNQQTVAVAAAATLQIINKCFNWCKFYVCTSKTIQQTNEREKNIRQFARFQLHFAFRFMCLVLSPIRFYAKRNASWHLMQLRNEYTAFFSGLIDWILKPKTKFVLENISNSIQHTHRQPIANSATNELNWFLCNRAIHIPSQRNNIFFLFAQCILATCHTKTT